MVLPSDQPIRKNVPGRVGPSVGEADDKHGVGLDTTTRDWVTGVNITSWNPNTSLRHDGPRARLKVALVPHHPSDLVLDLLGQEKTWPVGMVRAGDDEVPFETTLACLVQVPLKALDLQLQGRQVFSLSVNLTLLLLEHMTVYSDALDQGGRHLHKPLQDGLDRPLLVLLGVVDHRFSVQVGETETNGLQVPKGRVGHLEGGDHVVGGRGSGGHQVLQGREEVGHG